MKILSFICAALVIFFAAPSSYAAEYGESLSPGLLVVSADNPMTVSGVRGDSVDFDESDFSGAYLLGGDFSITVQSLPAYESGVLKLGNTDICAGQKLTSDGISSMRFIPSEDASDASFTFTFDGMYSAECIIKFTDGVNLAPCANSSDSAWTSLDLSYVGRMSGDDPDGDPLSYEICTRPQKGLVTADAESGIYKYTPYENVSGTDSFTYRVKDSYGNYSSEAAVAITIDSEKTDVRFCDMENESGYAEAVALVEDGVMKPASDESGKTVFEPDGEVSRMDFLICAMDAFGAENVPECKSTIFADDKKIPAEYKGYVMSAYSLGIIEGECDGVLTYMKPDETVSLAEAAVIINRILGLSPQSGAESQVSSPEWAYEDVCALCDAGILDSTDDTAAPLTRAMCARLVASALRVIS